MWIDGIWKVKERKCELDEWEGEIESREESGIFLEVGVSEIERDREV